MLWRIFQGGPGVGWQKEERPPLGGEGGRDKAELTPAHSGGFLGKTSSQCSLPGHIWGQWCLEAFPSVLGNRIGPVPPVRKDIHP